MTEACIDIHEPRTPHHQPRNSSLTSAASSRSHTRLGPSSWGPGSPQIVRTIRLPVPGTRCVLERCKVRPARSAVPQSARPTHQCALQGAPSSPAPSSASLSPRHASLGRLQNRPDLSREFKTSPSSPAPHTPSPDDTPVERARKRPAAQGRWQAPDVTGSQADDETGGSRATPATSRAHGAAPVRSPRSSQVSSSRGSFADEIDRRPAAHGTPERNPTFSDMAFSMHLDSASGAPAESAAPSQPGAAPQPDPAESDAPSTGPKEGPGGSSDFSGFQPSTGPVFEHPMLHAMDMESPSKTEASSQPTQELPR